MKPGSEPPDTPRSVLGFVVIAPHYVPEWSYDLVFFKDGKWFDWNENYELDYVPQFWADVVLPEEKP